MDARTIRTVVIEGLETGAVWQANRTDFREAFIEGTLDIELAKLDMDSLARMELCIAIEVGTGVSLAPEELERYKTLTALVAEVARRVNA
jgi:acyl carrier protein